MSQPDRTAGGRQPRSARRQRDSADARLVDRIVAQFRSGRRTAQIAVRPPVATGASNDGQAAAGDPIAAALALARRETDMDVAVLGEIRNGREVVRELAGDGKSFGMMVGASIPIEQSYCQRLLEGRLDNIVRDTRSEPLVRDLALTKLANVGAYIGVPLTSLEARLYILCCLAHEQRPALSEQHVLLLRRLAEGLAVELSAAPIG